MQKSISLTGLYLGMRIPADILLKYSPVEQEFPTNVYIENTLEVDQYITLGHLNGINLELICDLIAKPEAGYSTYDLEINGEYWGQYDSH